MSRNPVIRISSVKAVREPATQKRIVRLNPEIDLVGRGERRKTEPVSLGAFEQG